MTYHALTAALTMAMFLAQEPLEKIAVIELPGPKGQRFDSLSIPKITICFLPI